MDRLEQGDHVEVVFFERSDEWQHTATNQAKVQAHKTWVPGIVRNVYPEKFTVLLFNGSQIMDIYLAANHAWRRATKPARSSQLPPIRRRIS